MSNFNRAFKAFRPSPRHRTIRWAIDNVVNDQGRPYDHAAYPHLGAPGGPMDAFDDPRTRTVSLQWATRLGKTFFGQVALMKTADTDPAPMMFASSVEKLAKEAVSRVYATCHQRKRLNDLLLKNEREQKQDLVEFRGCKIFVAWSRSVSTLADKNVKVGHASEYDKWEHASTSKEAHPHKLFDDRFKDYQAVRKIIYEGTPTIKGKSPIERKRIAGSNCRYHVPCPHCRRYQALEFGKDTPHGVKWDKDEAGRHDPEVAYRTARYVCRYCKGECRDHHRAWMMRRGMWCPEGCEIDHEKALEIAEASMLAPGSHDWKGWQTAAWIIGRPVRDGADASYQLSSLYALSLGWGDIAKEFVTSKDIPQALRNFVNQWLGETWEIVERKQTWEQLGQRIIVKTPRLVVPAGFSMLTLGVDKQVDHYVYCCEAWREGRTSHTLDYGIEDSLDEIGQKLLDARFAREDRGDPLSIQCTLIDGRYRPTDLYKFCSEQLAKKRAVFPSFGSNKPLGVECRKVRLGDNTSMPGFPVVHVDTISTQDFIDNQLHTLRPGDRGSTSLYQGSLRDHEDFLQQLLNDAILPKIDTKGYVTEEWNRIDETIPNDYRDAKRYAFVAYVVATRNADLRPIPAPSKAPPQPKKPKKNFKFRRLDLRKKQ